MQSSGCYSAFFVSNNHFRYHFVVTKKDRHASKFSNISFASFDIFMLLRLTSRESVYLLSKHRSNSLNYQVKGL